MRQIWITGKGGNEVLDMREAVVPQPQGSQVRIRVKAAGVNFADVMLRLGLYPDSPKLPMVPGYEVAGIVDAVGKDVHNDLLGQNVVGMCNFGGYSEVVCLDQSLVWPCPENVNLISAASIPVNYLTAWQMVRVMAPVCAHDTVLVHSAAGGVGQAVIQLCQQSGASVIGSASPKKHEFLRNQGLDFVFDSQQRDFAQEVLAATDGHGVDIALEPRNGRWIMESYKSVAKCGRLIVFGFSNAAVGKGSGTFSALRTLAGVPWLQINPIRLMNDNKSIGGVNLARMWDQQAKTGRWMTELLGLFAAGTIKPQIDSVFSFAEVSDAFTRLENRSNIGKVILVPDEGDK